MEAVLENFFDEIRKKKKSVSIHDWVKNVSKVANQLLMVTHNGKYTHTGGDIARANVGKEVGCIAIQQENRKDGFLRTGNCEFRYINTPGKLDAFGNAAALPAYKFLSLVLSDGKTVFDHVQERSEKLRSELSLDPQEYDEICNNFLTMQLKDRNMKTSRLIKQIYFSVEKEEDYHLLSLLTSSCIVSEMKMRLDYLRFSQEIKEGREARMKNEWHEDFAELYDLTEITYGGANPQNVGILNAKCGGTAYLLPSMPPVLEKRNVRLPRTDFFRNCFKKGEFEVLYSKLYGIFEDLRNNIYLRDYRESIFQGIIENIIKKSWEIRNYEPGWSFRDYYKALPMYQKIWLDPAREDDKKENDEWLQNVIIAMTQWICIFSPLPGKQTQQYLGDVEFQYIKSLIENAKEVLQ